LKTIYPVTFEAINLQNSSGFLSH